MINVIDNILLISISLVIDERDENKDFIKDLKNINLIFADIINFKYDANDVDADIRHLLKTGEFKPKYADMVRRFMLAEITNCKRTVEDKNNHITVFLQGTMSEDNLTKTHEEITPILDRLGF